MNQNEVIVDGSKLIDLTPFGILYAMGEGTALEFLGCRTEELADSIIKRFEETGELENPRGWMSELNPLVIYPSTVIKAELTSYKVKVHKSIAHSFE